MENKNNKEESKVINGIPVGGFENKEYCNSGMKVFKCECGYIGLRHNNNTFCKCGKIGKLEMIE